MAVGSGKSVLRSVSTASTIFDLGPTQHSAAVVDDLLLRQLQPGSLINFFFCEHDNARSLNARTILGCLARQCILRCEMTETLQRDLETLFGDGTVDADELGAFFIEQNNVPRTHFILIDGLDECAESDRETILSTLQALLSLDQPHIKLFLSGRDAILTAISETTNIDSHQKMDCRELFDDIEVAIDALLSEKKQKHKLVLQDPGLEQDIRIALKSGAGGM